MENSVVLLCKRGASTVLILLSRTLRFEELVLKLCSKFDDLKPCLVSLSYTLPGHPFCMLDCDDDIQALTAVVLRCLVALIV